MSTSTKIILSGLAVALVAAVLVLGFRTGPPGPPGRDGQTLSGIGPASSFFEFGGNRIYGGGMALTKAASTTCSIVSPASTSTLLSAAIKFDTATSSGTMFIEMGRATDPYSTTTLIGTKYALANSVPDFITASTSPAAGKPEVFGPNTYFNIKIGGSQAITAATQPVGRCQAIFVEYPTL